MAVTLVKEDGTGLPGANSYEDVAGADQYFEDTGRKTAWKAFSSAVRTSALIVATQFMDDTYGCRWFGSLAQATQDTQALDWPRDGLLAPSGAAIASTAIPAGVLRAAAEYALIAAAGPIDPDPTYDPSGKNVTYNRLRVEGAVEKETHFGGGSNPTISRRYPQAERSLRGLITPVSRTLLRA